MHTDPAAVSYLYSLQRDLLGPLAQDHVSPDSELMAAARSEPGDVDHPAAEGEALLDDEAPPPTPYEPAIGYSILRDLAAEIVAALRKIGSLPNPPLVGTLPLGWPAALLLRVPVSTSHIVVVDREFTIFANLLAKACAQALLPASRGQSAEQWEESLRSGSHPAIPRYLELMFAATTTSPVAAPAYTPGPELSGLLNQLRTAIEIFVISEPYTHLASGHDRTAAPLPMHNVHGSAESYLWTESQWTESITLRLDVVGAVFDAQGLPDRALGNWSIQMFLVTVAMLGKMLASDGRRGGAPSRAEVELEFMRKALLRSEGEESRSLQLVERLSPVQHAFATHVQTALGRRDAGVH